MPATSATQSTVEIADYDHSYNDAVVSLFVAGMEDNIAAMSNAFDRDRISNFIKRAIPTLRDIPKLVNEERGGRVFIALSSDVNKSLIGMIAMARSGKDQEQSTVELTRISVAREWRRKGICRALVGHAIRVAVKEFGVQSLYLYTATTVKAAMSSYERMGFELQDPRPPDGEFAVVKFVLDLDEGGWWQK